MTAKMSPQRTVSNGRKVDTWSVEMPDKQKYDVTVNMITDGDGTRFHANCSKGLLRDLSLSSADINHLRKMVASEADTIAENYLGAGWVEAFRIVTKQANKAPRKSSGFGLDVSWSPLRVDRSQPPSNIGELHVIEEGAPYTTIQRGHTDILDDTDIENMVSRMKLRRDEGSSVAVVDATEDTTTRLYQMREIFLVFNDMLLTRMSPDEIGRNGIPEHDELVKLMADAAEAHRAGKRIAEPGEDEILI
tara:strand:+ start:1075 stop:1818 length:744 start_codon:yes stop_codon:yes gene_type:complete